MISLTGRREVGVLWGLCRREFGVLWILFSLCDHILPCSENCGVANHIMVSGMGLFHAPSYYVSSQR